MSAAMTEKHYRVVSQIKELEPECKSIQYFLHGKSHALPEKQKRKKETAEPITVSYAVKIVNYMKCNVLN